MDNNYNDYNPYSRPENGFQEPSSIEETYGRTEYEAQDTASIYAKPTYTVPERKKSNFGKTLAKTAAIAFVFGLIAGGTGLSVLHFGGNALGVFADADEDKDDDRLPNSSTDNDSKNEGNKNQKPTGPLEQTNTNTQSIATAMDVSDIVSAAMPSVVAINNTSEKIYENWWGQSYVDKSESCGTGFLVEQDEKYIYIATNNHVIEGATTLTVQFSDGAVVEAQIKGKVPSKDLAVITVEMKDISAETLNIIHIATLGNSNKLEVGEAAIAIGNALGYGQSVTTGVISALGRSVTVQDSSTGTKVVNNNLIQTDAAINPGNSGGALLNIKGEVIGINSVKYSDTSVEGIGYAIPITDAMLIIDKLIDGGNIEETKPGYLGIQGQDCAMGAYIYKVLSGSAAEKAGLRAGDIVVEMESTTISTMNQLKELLSYYSAGQEVKLLILRSNGNEYVEKEITVTLGDEATIQQ